jgi:hypothetical protein
MMTNKSAMILTKDDWTQIGEIIRNPPIENDVDIVEAGEASSVAGEMS